MKKLIYLFAVASLVFNSSCKDDSDIGLSLQDNSDLLNTTLIDTLELNLSTVLYNEAIYTDSTYTLIVGDYNDPFVGSVKATSFFQLVPAYNFGGTTSPDAVFDSAVFISEYYKDSDNNPYYYGDTTTPINLTLHRVTEDFENRKYTSTESLTIDPQNLVTRQPGFIYPGKDRDYRMTLDATVGQEIFDAFTDSITFLNNFKGFALSAEGSGPATAFTSYEGTTDSTRTKLVVYFHIGDDILSTHLQLTENTVRFTQITPDYSGTDLATLVSNGDAIDESQSSFVYLQNGTGVCTHVDLSELSKVYSELENKAINKAEIVLHINENSYSSNQDAPPLVVNLYKTDSLSMLPLNNDPESAELTLDRYSSSLFSPSLSSLTYTIPLTSYFQQIVIGNDSYGGLLLFPYGNTGSVNRGVIYGNNAADPSKRPQLKIYYTE